MRCTLLFLFTLMCAGSLLLADVADATRYWHKKKANERQGETTQANKKKDKEKEKPFATVIKDYKKIEGLFDLYIDSTENKVYMAIKSDQFDKIYLASITRSAGDGTYYDAGAQAGSFPFKLKRIGKQIQFLIVNVRYRADSTKAFAGALKRSISHSIFGSAKFASKPDSTGTILINPTGIFITDLPNAGYFIGKQRKTEFCFDDKNSYFGAIKSFPENSEIDVILHYKTSKPSTSVTIGSPYSMFLTYHYSLSTIPETDYRPRLADDRVGYFMTQYQDYTDLAMESPYVRFINRWNLQKKNPTAALSEPVEPIVFWVGNTVPEEYREYVAQGIKWWNPAFEKIGFKNAMVARQMPDTADWDPADIRYNVIQWVVRPGAAYAAGPSRANPFTGEIYDADVRVMADFIRHMYNYAERYVEPLATSRISEEEKSSANQLLIEAPFGQWQPICTHGFESSLQATEALALVQTRATLADKPELTKKYIHQYIVELIAHEVGHCLGLRHNFKASVIYSREQRCDREFTAVHSIHGSIMEYAPANIAPEGFEQADFYMTIPGPYDYWAIEYGYQPVEAPDFMGERDALDEIASRGAIDPNLVYLTDEDCFGNSPRAIDPYAAAWDLGSDPLEYWTDRIAMSRELWSKVESLFEKPGQNYKKLRNVFQYGWSGFASSGAHMARFIGGIENNRNHVGEGKLPFVPIPATQQREAMKFLREQIWAPDVFQISPELINKLQPERLPDFKWSVYNMQRIDYPLHNQILYVQTRPLKHIYNSITLARINDITMHYAPQDDIYTMTEIFQDIRRAIWTPEITTPHNINSTRRNLQRAHLDIIIKLVTNKMQKVPEDARTLARVDLKVLKGAIAKALRNGNFDTITRGHLEESAARIDAAMNADLSYKM